MSPEPIAADHVYRLLKSDIMDGHYAPSSPLNVHQIAVEIGVSISPVRDAMERLVGERLLAARGGGGFQMPAVTEVGLRDLYLWHSHLARGAVRTGANITLCYELLQKREEDRLDGNWEIVSATTAFFGALAALVGNEEYRVALQTAGERLHAARLREDRFIRDRDKELRRLLALTLPGSESMLREALGNYHRRRIRHLGALREALYHRI